VRLNRVKAMLRGQIHLMVKVLSGLTSKSECGSNDTFFGAATSKRGEALPVAESLGLLLLLKKHVLGSSTSPPAPPAPKLWQAS